MRQPAPAPAGHCPQLVTRQSDAHPVLWSQIAETNGAAQAKSPLASWKLTSNGARHVAHDGLFACSNAKKARHPFEAGPAMHAARAFVRSTAEHTCWIGGCAVVTLPGHAPYGAGQVVCWFLQVRGRSAVSHDDLVAVQLVHALPPEPHEVARNPGRHPCVGSQHPRQLVALHGGGGGVQRPEEH